MCPFLFLLSQQYQLYIFRSSQPTTTGLSPAATYHLSRCSCADVSHALVVLLFRAAIRCLGHIPEAVVSNISYLHGMHAPHCPSSASDWVGVFALSLHKSTKTWGAICGHLAYGPGFALAATILRLSLLFRPELFSSRHCLVRIRVGGLYLDDFPQQCCVDESPQIGMVMY